MLLVNEHFSRGKCSLFHSFFRSVNAHFPGSLGAPPRWAGRGAGTGHAEPSQGCRRQALGLMKKSGRRQSPKTSARSGEETQEVTIHRRQALGLIKKSGSRNGKLDPIMITGGPIGYVEHSCVGRNAKLHFCKGFSRFSAWQDKH